VRSVIRFSSHPSRRSCSVTDRGTDPSPGKEVGWSFRPWRPRCDCRPPTRAGRVVTAGRERAVSVVWKINVDDFAVSIRLVYRGCHELLVTSEYKPLAAYVADQQLSSRKQEMV